jgi:beta-phosphoglucomutase
MLKTVFFDFNGILVDDERVHFGLFREILEPLGIPMTEAEYFGRYFGYSDRDLFEIVFGEHAVKIKRGRIDALIRLKNERYLDIVRDRTILFPGARDAVETFGSVYPVGIVSGALRAEIEAVIEREEWAGFFQVVVAAEDVGRGKPDPEGYVIALDRMNNIVDLDLLPVNPSECLVIEDSPAGIAAARALGMRCVAVASSVPRSDLVEADMVVDEIGAIRMDRVRALFGDPLDPGRTSDGGRG